MKPVDEAKIGVACIQMEPVFGEVDRNVRHSVGLMEQAAQKGANLVVLPELCNTGYVFQTRAEARELAESLEDGRTVKAWQAAARELDLHLVAGITERDGERLYNSAVVIGPDGMIGRYRKNHLWADEALFFERGDLGFPVFDLPFGRLGCLICYDGWFPEAYRLLALQGAEIVCVPTNWVPVPGGQPDDKAIANVLTMAAAHCNSIFVAAADRVGTERGQPFIGRSLIAGHTGWAVAGPASAREEEIIVAEINLAAARRGRNWNAFNQVLRDRRRDLYGEMLGAETTARWY